MTVESVAAKISEEFNGVEIYPEEGKPTEIEIVTWIETSNGKPIHIFLDFASKIVIVSDGGYLSGGFYGVSSIPSNQEILTSLDSFNIKIHKDDKGVTRYYKVCHNESEVVESILVLSEIIKALVNCALSHVNNLNLN